MVGNDCIDLIEGEHKAIPRRIALLDILNVRRIMAENVGFRIDLAHEEPGEVWNEAVQRIPTAFSRYMYRLTVHLEWGRLLRGYLDETPAKLDVCFVGSTFLIDGRTLIPGYLTKTLGN